MIEESLSARTPRLEIRRTSPEDLDAIWEYRRLPEVNRWLGLAPETREAFREIYLEPERLATLFSIVLLPDDGADAAVIGDVMIKIGDGWAQREVADEARGVEAELGWVLSPAFTGQATPRKPSAPSSMSASAGWACAGYTPDASPTTSHRGASWSGSECDARSSAARPLCTARVNGWTG